MMLTCAPAAGLSFFGAVVVVEALVPLVVAVAAPVPGPGRPDR
jgi:hypothetical protein